MEARVKLYPRQYYVQVAWKFAGFREITTIVSPTLPGSQLHEWRVEFGITREHFNRHS